MAAEGWYMEPFWSHVGAMLEAAAYEKYMWNQFRKDGMDGTHTGVGQRWAVEEQQRKSTVD